MTKLQKLLLSMCVTLIIGIIGCSAFQDSIVPCWVDREAITLSGADVPRLLPYTTIADAEYVQARLEYVHTMGEVEYNYIQNNITTHLENAEQFRGTLFNPTGAIGLLLPSLSFLGIGALAISKPSDKKKIEELKNGTNS